MNTKKLGKISSVRFGHGGYQDACLGVSLTFEGKGWGVGTWIGGWDAEKIKCDKYCKWTEEDRSNEYADTMRKISKLLKQAKVSEIHSLKGIPVEVEFDSTMMKDWRILEEVL